MAAKKAKKTTAAEDFQTTAPAGYTKVETRIQGFWKPKDPGDWIEGVVGERVEMPGSDGKSNVWFTLRLATDECEHIENAKGEHVPAEGAMLVGIGGKTLANFMTSHVGLAVYIVYKGLGTAKKGQNAPRLYDTYEKGDAEADAD